MLLHEHDIQIKIFLKLVSDIFYEDKAFVLFHAAMIWLLGGSAVLLSTRISSRFRGNVFVCYYKSAFFRAFETLQMERCIFFFFS